MMFPLALSYIYDVSTSIFRIAIVQFLLVFSYSNDISNSIAIYKCIVHQYCPMCVTFPLVFTQFPLVPHYTCTPSTSIALYGHLFPLITDYTALVVSKTQVFFYQNIISHSGPNRQIYSQNWHS